MSIVGLVPACAVISVIYADSRVDGASNHFSRAVRAVAAVESKGGVAENHRVLVGSGRIFGIPLLGKFNGVGISFAPSAQVFEYKPSMWTFSLTRSSVNRGGHHLGQLGIV